MHMLFYRTRPKTMKSQDSQVSRFRGSKTHWLKSNLQRENIEPKFLRESWSPLILRFVRYLHWSRHIFHQAPCRLPTPRHVPDMGSKQQRCLTFSIIYKRKSGCDVFWNLCRYYIFCLIAKVCLRNCKDFFLKALPTTKSEYNTFFQIESSKSCYSMFLCNPYSKW